ncbi:MAG TPA: hypothetical protein VH478_26130 [Trebonia sp.]|nr:hypothetical protein [Trebonia sp.]
MAGTLVGPFLYLAASRPDPAEVTVMTRGAAYLLHHGTPYLPLGQLTSWTSYNPYLPLIDLLGLPRAAGLAAPLGDPRVYTALLTTALTAAAFALVTARPAGAPTAPGAEDAGAAGAAGDSEPGRSADWARVARLTAIGVTSPVIGFQLVLGITDPPIIALTCLALACLSRGWLTRAAVVIAVASASKYTAWPLVPVFAVMAWARYSPGRAVRLTVTTLAAAAALALAAAPNALSDTASVAANTLDYPLGLTKIKTVAASPLPGHLIASTGHAGHTIAVALLLLAGLAFAAWLVLRPPRTQRAVAIRLVVAYTAMFTLAPATRYGYYIYPLALLAWSFLSVPPDERQEPVRQEAR